MLNRYTYVYFKNNRSLSKRKQETLLSIKYEKAVHSDCALQERLLTTQTVESWV